MLFALLDTGTSREEREEMAKTLYYCPLPREKVSGEVKDTEALKGRREGEDEALKSKGEDRFLKEWGEGKDSILKERGEDEI